MREIKFRGKRLDNGEWEYGDLLQYDDGSVCIGVHSKNYTDDGFNVGQYHHIAPVNEDTVGEYTGLKDRKGIAIYEGDVIRSPLSEDKTRPHRIFYHTGNAAFMGALIDRKELCYLRLDQDWIYKFGKEVIGNIHRQSRISERRRAMNRTMKQWLLPLICRWFGHKDFEEVYCVKSPRNWVCRQNKPNRYDVVHDIVCSRCRRVHRTILKSRISRAQLLHDGWFIIDE